jgi:predicted PurR-regulated permease PerM
MSESANQQSDKQFVKPALEAAIRIVALLIIAVACYDILKPFIVPLIWAAIIAVAVKPISDWLENKLTRSRKMAATLVTLALLSTLIAPTAIVVNVATDRLQQISVQLESGEFQLPNPDSRVQEWPLIGEKMYNTWSAATNNLEGFLKKHEQPVKDLGRAVLNKLAGLGVTVLIMVFSIIVAGVFLVGADGAQRFAIQFTSRLAGEQGKKFASMATVTVRNVTRGILGVAILQAALAGLGFYVIDLPAAALLAGIVLVMSIVQINPILLMVPLAVYVFSYASPAVAIIYLIWSIAVGIMDNILKPIIMGKGADVPIMVIFLGAVGGFVSMGFIGLFVGAVILVVGYDLFIAWLGQSDTAKAKAA